MDSGKEMVSTQTAPRLSSFHFYFAMLWWFSLRQKERKNHVQMFSASLFLCVLALGMYTEGSAGLQGCFISLTIPASFTSTQWGQMMLKRPLRKSRGERLVQSVGAFGISHGESQWEPVHSLMRSPPKSSTHIMAITGSFRDHKVNATTVLAHQKMGGRLQWNGTQWLFRFTSC